MNDNTLRYLSYADVVRCDVSMLDVREVVHQAFYEKGNSLVETPPKRGIAPDSKSTIRAMKAFMPSLGTGGCKWISAYPDNMSQGLPTITGLIMLNDINTGLPKAVMDCTWITAMRTACLLYTSPSPRDPL